jgi:elongation factor G
MKPNEKGKGLTVENKVVGGTIPKEYINAVIKGVNEAMTNGIIAGYPVIDVHVDISMAPTTMWIPTRTPSPWPPSSR